MAVLKKSVAMLLVFTMLFAVVISTSVSASAAAYKIQRQTDSKWKTVYVGGRTMSATACGIFSLVNAIGYLTGSAPDVYSAAVWAHNIGAFNTPSAGGTYRTALYPRIQAKYGSTYGFTCDCGSGNTGYWSTASSSTLKAHLSKGGVAIGHVPGHFIALVGYDYSTNKFHVYDSAPSSSRGTNSYGTTGLGDCWVTQSRLSTGKLDLDWFCLLTATGTPANQSPTVSWSVGNYQLLGNKYLRETASTASNIIVTIPKGEVMQVVEVVNSSFGKIQYGDFVGYMTLDEDTKYIGGFGHGGTTITSADKRTPGQDYVATWNDVQGAAGYHWKVLELDGAPNPGSESEAGKLLIDSTTYLYQDLSVTVPAASMTTGKYLKIAVQTVFPNNVNYWSFKYVACSELPFTDVDPTSWYYENVKYCYKNDYLNGTTESTFEPDLQINRATVAVVLHRLAGEPAHKNTVLPYNDVSSQDWYYNSVVWCYENGVLPSATSLAPTTPISREETAVMFHSLAEYMGEDTQIDNFYNLLYWDDASEINCDYYEEMAWAVESALLRGDTNNHLNPADTLTRAQLATMIYNYDSFVTAENVGDITGDTAD